MNKNKGNLIAITFTVVLLLSAYFLGLFINLTGDAGKYGAIARHIIDSGDWINLKIHGEPYEQKPPLLFWLVSFGFEIGGLHNWAFKIFPVLYSFLGVWFTSKLGETLYNKQTGRIAAFMLASSWVYFLFTMDVHTDLVLQANVTLAIWQLAIYEKHKKHINFILAFIGVGLSMMTKGPIGAAIPAFALGTHLIIKRDFKELFNPKWILGIAIALLICLPAFIGLYNQFGLQGFKFFFFTNNVGRITGSYAGNNTDYFFYFHTILYLVLPWTIYLLFAFFNEFKSYLHARNKNREYYTLGGIWIFFIIATIAKGKAPHYIFSLIPMFLVITARWLNYYLQKPLTKVIKQLINIQLIITILLYAFIVLIMLYLFPTRQFVYWALLALTFVTFILMQIFIKETTLKLLLPSMLTMAMLIIVLNGEALPSVFKYQSTNQACKIYNEKAPDNAPLYNYLYPQYELFFYAKGNAKRMYSINDYPLNEQETWVFTNQTGMDSLSVRYPENIAEIYTFQHHNMTNLKPSFLNPASRQKSLRTMYLLQMLPKEE